MPQVFGVHVLLCLVVSALSQTQRPASAYLALLNAVSKAYFLDVFLFIFLLADLCHTIL